LKQLLTEKSLTRFITNYILRDINDSRRTILAKNKHVLKLYILLPCIEIPFIYFRTTSAQSD